MGVGDSSRQHFKKQGRAPRNLAPNSKLSKVSSPKHDASIIMYIAGKVSKNSQFGTHHWRDKFCDELAELSGLNLKHLDPLSTNQHENYSKIFSDDCKLIEQCDVLLVYLSDDISVGGSQEIIIAKYLGKPVIGYAPYGGKFNGCEKEMFGKVIIDYQDPFVFSTCDFVCGDIREVINVLKTFRKHEYPNLDKIINTALQSPT